MIPYAQQDISQADIDSVIEVLRSDFITQGPIIPSFEGSVAHYCGADHAVAVNSATSAAHCVPCAWPWAGRLALDKPKYLRCERKLCFALRCESGFC